MNEESKTRAQFQVTLIDDGWFVVDENILGKLIATSCMLSGGCGVRFLMHKLCCSLGWRRFGLRVIGMLLAALWTDDGLGWGWLGCYSLLFGLTKVWAEGDWDATPSVSLLRVSFAASCLSDSKLRLAFSHWWTPAVSVWGLLLLWLMDNSRLWFSLTLNTATTKESPIPIRTDRHKKKHLHRKRKAR